MPAWIEALKELTRKTPTQHDIDILSEEVMSEKNDRGAALIAGTLTEDVLRALVKSALIPLSKPETEALFGRDAPLSSFSKMIRVAYAFGLIDTDTRRDFDRIREIRNTFAHAMTPVSFGTPAIAEACKGFTKGPAYADFPFPADHPRSLFVSANGRMARVVNVYLSQVLNEGVKAKSALPLTYAIDPGPRPA